MASVELHYRDHLGPLYEWMAGGIEAAVRAGEEDLAALTIDPAQHRHAVDLGAGIGAHAIPLARRGVRVLAVDSCAGLLDTLARESHGLPVATQTGDLLAFRGEPGHEVDLILCMGDTLMHLRDASELATLFRNAWHALAAGGLLALTFRDYSAEPPGTSRFILVRADDARLLTCHLLYGDRTVQLTDVVHERTEDGWRLASSSYEKLRLAPGRVAELLRAQGFEVRTSVVHRGMVGLVAQRS
jgi:SAM-dependent methyltransferase